MIPQRIQSPEAALGALSQDLGTAFERALDSVTAVRTSAKEFETSVALLQKLGDPDAEMGEERGSFAMFSEHAARATGAAEAAAADLDAEAFRSGLQSLSLVLGELKRNTIELAAVSSLTKITKTENPAVAERLGVFTETLDRRFRELQTSTARAAELVDDIRHESDAARTSLRAIIAELRRISREAGSGTGALRELERAHLEQMEQLAEDTRVLGQQVQAAVGRLIACLQFPDALAQRIEHVRTMLAALDTPRDAAEKSAIAGVAAAQLKAMSVALVDATEGAISAIDAIPLNGRRGGSGLALGGDDASGAWIEAQAKASEATIHAVAASRRRLDAAVALIGRIVAQVDAVRSLLEDSRRQNQELDISVHNASIVASRFSSGASALHVLAEGVKRVVGQVSRSVARIFDDLGRIRRVSEVLQQTPLSRELDTLGEVQDRVARTAEADAVKLAKAREAREQLTQAAQRLSQAARDGRARFQAAQRQAAAFEAIAAQLGTALVPGDVEGCDLGWIEALYTMNEERAVHERVFGKVAAAPAAADELDDFLL